MTYTRQEEKELNFMSRYGMTGKEFKKMLDKKNKPFKVFKFCTKKFKFMEAYLRDKRNEIPN